MPVEYRTTLSRTGRAGVGHATEARCRGAVQLQRKHAPAGQERPCTAQRQSSVADVRVLLLHSRCRLCHCSLHGV